jgi:signal transduction histidine kinase
MNYTEALAMGAFGNLSTEQEAGLDKIRAQAAHLLRLINAILEITSIESGVVNLHNEPLNLAEFIADNRSDYAMSDGKEVAVEWKFLPDLPVITSDRAKLKQILSNLIDNAIKFTDRGGVTVAVETLDADQILQLQVSDTGCGIPSEMLPLIFDKFRQIDGTMTRDHSGAGLGLYVVKLFVELLRGTIAVQSTVGAGSVFTVRIPVGGENNAARPALYASHGSAGVS